MLLYKTLTFLMHSTMRNQVTVIFELQKMVIEQLNHFQVSHHIPKTRYDII